MNQSNNPILVFNRLGIQAGDVLMITNCRVGDIFIAGAIQTPLLSRIPYLITPQII